MEEYERDYENLKVSTRNFEIQFGQLARLNNERPLEVLPSDIIPNPKEQCKVITLRSGKELEERVGRNSMKNGEQEGVEDENKEKEESSNGQDKMMNESIMPNSQSNEGKDPKCHEPKHVNVPFPQRLRDEEKSKKFKKFLEIFKKLEINIPFMEALENMPTYAKFMKQVLTSKRKLHGDEILCLTKHCSALLRTELPPKLKDPGSFSIPCEIRGLQFGRALCDLGASINLMPFGVFKKLN
ncbi:hypothetical protein ACH5RR_018309 [Cinchona calisaya]|uniref:Uncharacterized protein n=1 Tax=Cinchona calisaya TaxID=153742 RepID=A0ABD2ZL37_9GENT